MLDTRQLIARRIGRIVFGGVLITGVAYLAMVAATGSSSLFGCRHGHSHGRSIDAARIVSTTWLVALLAGAIARHVAARLPLRGAPGALFAESVMAPTIGIALLLPITLHMPIALLLGGGDAFDVWVQASLWLTALAHAVFAFTCARRGYHLVAGKPAWTPRKIYLVTLLTSCVPFVLLWAIPPALVALTALPFIPMLRAMARMIERERAEIAAAPHALPRAVVRRPPA